MATVPKRDRPSNAGDAPETIRQRDAGISPPEPVAVAPARSAKSKKFAKPSPSGRIKQARTAARGMEKTHAAIRSEARAIAKVAAKLASRLADLGELIAAGDIPRAVRFPDWYYIILDRVEEAEAFTRRMAAEFVQPNEGWASDE